MKTLSVLHCEAFQARASCGELNAKKRKERRRAEHETIADGPTPGGGEKSPVALFELEQTLSSASSQQLSKNKCQNPVTQVANGELMTVGKSG